jgi:hypothetical protein
VPSSGLDAQPLPGPDPQLAAVLDRLREADATVDAVMLPDGTSRLLVTLPFLEVRDVARDPKAA